MDVIEDIEEIIPDYADISSSTYKQGLIGLLICSIGDLFAGIALGSMTHTLELLPGLMILITPAIGMRGNVFGALGSRLGTALHTGIFSAKLDKHSILGQNIMSAMINTIVLSVALGFIAKIFAAFFGIESISLRDFVFISIIGGIISGFFMLQITVGIALAGFKYGWDIDNLNSPIITASGDLITLPAIFIATVFLNFLTQTESDLIIKIIFYSSIIIAIASFIYILILTDLKITKRIVLESFPVLLIAGTLSAIAGLTIDSQLEHLLIMPVLLVLIPPFLGVNNALGGILTSRLSSMLHTGIMDPNLIPNKLAIRNFILIYIFLLIIFPMVGLSSFISAKILNIDSIELLNLMLIATIAGFIAVTIVNIIGYYIAVAAYKLRLDPDNYGIPLSSSAIDAFGTFCLVFVLLLFGLI